jgi:hypothetical protein
VFHNLWDLVYHHSLTIVLDKQPGDRRDRLKAVLQELKAQRPEAMEEGEAESEEETDEEVCMMPFW